MVPSACSCHGKKDSGLSGHDPDPDQSWHAAWRSSSNAACRPTPAAPTLSQASGALSVGHRPLTLPVLKQLSCTRARVRACMHGS
eukprot:199279-Chlamydomonas_euryale.AAC.7